MKAKSLSKALVKVAEVICVIALAFMSLAVLLQIILRFAGTGLGWTEEMSRYFMVWMTIVGASLMIVGDSDIRAEFLIERLPEKIRKFLYILNSALVLCFLLVMTYFGVIKAYDAINITATSVKISMAFFYAAIPAGGFLMLMQLILRLYIHKGERPPQQ